MLRDITSDQNDLHGLPDAIEATNLAHFAAGKTLDAVRAQASQVAAEIKTEVLSAKNEAGKPLYSNDQQRDAAITIALATDDEYQQLVQDVEHAERLKATLAAKLERLRGDYRIALIDYEADRLGRRSAA